MSKNPILNFDDVCHTFGFGYITTSGLGSRISISGICHCYIYLWTFSLTFRGKKTLLLALELQ